MRATRTCFMLMVQDMDRAVAFYAALGLCPPDTEAQDPEGNGFSLTQSVG